MYSPLRLLATSLGITASMFIVTATEAAIPELDWSPIVPIDTGVSDLGDSGGPPAVYNTEQELWQLVYTKAGDIYYVEGDASGWSTPLSISNDPSAARSPSIGSSGSLIHVAWEDERSGHSEIWTRRFDGASWTSAECLTCDGLPSRTPALDGSGNFENVNTAYLVWVEEDGSGIQSIQGRGFEESTGSWGTQEAISGPSPSATEPTIAYASGNFGWESSLVVAWTDTRHGESEVYLRKFGEYQSRWEDEERVTDLVGNSSRPSVAEDICCFDQPRIVSTVVFENDASGVPEVWYARYWDEWWPELASQDDGVASTSPTISGIKFNPGSCYDFDDNILFVTWTDEDPDGSSQRTVRYDENNSVEDDPVAVGDGTVGTLTTHTKSPDAPIFQAWAASDGNLFARVGADLNCRVDELVVTTDHYLYIEPSGGVNTATLTETCRDEPVPAASLRLKSFNGFMNLLAFDPEEDPEPLFETDGNGVATFSLRGGGCITEEAAGYGVAIIGCGWGWGVFSGAYDYYTQVKSPDIDGTCSVDEWDLEYVQAALATDDFCADLDGSGWVDQIDIDIVTAALGDACGTTTSVGDEDLPDSHGTGSDSATIRTIRVVPNPGRDRFEVLLQLEPNETATIRIVDVSGRTVRDFGELSSTGTDLTPASVVWDGRDNLGNLYPTGIYFADVMILSNGSLKDRLKSTIIVTK